MFFHRSIKMNLLFLRKFFENPAEVGSITPSSTYLTDKMLAPVAWNEARNIVELGAGTGVFTQAIHKSVRRDCTVAVFEKEAEMRKQLAGRFPDFHLFENALDLRLSLDRIGMEKADAIVSGLPFANFYPLDREQIITQVKQCLKKDGMFITFQYSLQMKAMLESHFRQVTIQFVPLNIPPAFVYICQ